MRTIYFMLFYVITGSTILSCSPEDEQESQQCEATIGADLIAFGESIIACAETGLGVVCPECCVGFGAVAAGIASSEASIVAPNCPSSLNGHSKNSENEIILPAQYRLPNNPYECAGETHNRVVFFILKNGGTQQVQNIISGNSGSLNQLASIFSSCNSEINSGEFTGYLQANLNALYYSQNLEKFRTHSIEQLFNSSSLAQYTNYIEGIYNEVIDIRQAHPDDTGKVMDYLNEKIEELLSSGSILTEDQEFKAKSLTFLKHTYYYWYD